ncbi:acyl-CoA-binding domain-containing protein 4 [Homalodisca vitripennis]|uniref:acyl-CoA-binding domain-containing protein 4 n=1 Tax=Homalodisca vitripennis TaxID=197043 RepID=UPI001EEAC786|nr:acyl-CoA-binding domain-containing protein 4 [Homalodisca vitripennis]
MSVQEKFEKAVNVIKNLPKHGSYQPSNELQLRFYAYYKQATEGFNYHPRPSFWEVVKRAKWDAWSKLGNMSKEEAMIHYVEELRKIVETMSYTDNVANFLNSLDDFYENVPVEDLEMLMGPIIQQIRSRPNSPLSGSPLASRDTSPTRTSSFDDTQNPRLRRPPAPPNTKSVISGSLETSPTSSYSASPLPPDTDDEDENFLDTEMEPEGKDSTKPLCPSDNSPSELPGNNPSEDQLDTHQPRPVPVGNKDPAERRMASEPTVSLEVKQEIVEIKKRLQSIETTIQSEPCTPAATNSVPGGTPVGVVGVNVYRMVVVQMGREVDILRQRMADLEEQNQREIEERNATWRPLGLPMQTTIFLMAWPLLMIFFAKWLSERRNR